MAQNRLARIVGERVALAGQAGAFRTCPECEGASGIVRQGAGPHLAALRCAECGRHISWLSEASVIAIGAAIDERAAE